MTITITKGTILFSGQSITRPYIGAVALELQDILHCTNSRAEYTCEAIEKMELFQEQGFLHVTFMDDKKYMLIFIENDERFTGATKAQLRHLVRLTRKFCEEENLPKENYWPED